MGFSLDAGVPAVTVFVQGILSFFSPCVLPLLPLYIGYLSGGTAKRGEDGRMYYERKKVMVHTLFFVLGISFAFFALGLGVSALGRFFKGNQTLFARIGGIFVFLMGAYQLGIFGAFTFLSKERRLPFSVGSLAMSPAAAFLLGFTFSFAWTPCVGPALASVLMMAASAATQGRGFFLIGVYTAGFVIPFLLVGLFTTTLLDFFKKHGNLVKYTAKAGAVLMMLMGVMMFTGSMNTVTGYLSEEKTQEAGQESMPEDESGGRELSEDEKNGGETPEDERTADDVIPAIDFTLTDQYGNTHTLSDYRGKTVFLNFWATWCPPCRREMPDIQALYEKYSAEEEPSVIILGIAAPELGQEQDEEGIAAFLEENGYTYPVVMDRGGQIFAGYGIYSYPTTMMIDKDGNVFGYASGQLNESMMQSIIDQTVTGIRKETAD
ncbi:cytochrome c biogenesis protein CcdA [Lachnospiraceae bacterium 45-P1]